MKKKKTKTEKVQLETKEDVINYVCKCRKKFRDDTGVGIFTTKEYRRQINAHAFTLEKYLKNFHIFLADFMCRRFIKYSSTKKEEDRIARDVIREGFCECVGIDTKRYNQLIDGKYPTIQEVLVIQHAFSELLVDFKNYLVQKTNLSFNYKNPVGDIYLKPNWAIRLRNLDKTNGNECKFGEFIYLIMAEYIILHNYMWSSGLKPKGVRTIDKWMKSI